MTRPAYAFRPCKYHPGRNVYHSPCDHRNEDKTLCGWSPNSEATHEVQKPEPHLSLVRSEEEGARPENIAPLDTQPQVETESERTGGNMQIQDSKSRMIPVASFDGTIEDSRSAVSIGSDGSARLRIVVAVEELPEVLSLISFGRSVRLHFAVTGPEPDQLQMDLADEAQGFLDEENKRRREEADDGE